MVGVDGRAVDCTGTWPVPEALVRSLKSSGVGRRLRPGLYGKGHRDPRHSTGSKAAKPSKEVGALQSCRIFLPRQKAPGVSCEGTREKHSWTLRCRISSGNPSCNGSTTWPDDEAGITKMTSFILGGPRPASRSMGKSRNGSEAAGGSRKKRQNSGRTQKGKFRFVGKHRPPYPNRFVGAGLLACKPTNRLAACGRRPARFYFDLTDDKPADPFMAGAKEPST